MKLERRNAYLCPDCMKLHITVDVADGVTPMFIKCEGCGKTASSFGYQLPGILHGAPTPSGKSLSPEFEWYKPGDTEYLKLSVAEKEHVDKGGLLMRKRTTAAPIYHVRR